MLKIVENISTGAFHIVSPDNELKTLCGRKFGDKNWDKPSEVLEDKIRKLKPLCMWCWYRYRHKHYKVSDR